MNKIFEKLVYAPNKWFDRLKEPKRFLVFIGGIVPFIFAWTIYGSMNAALLLLVIGVWRVLYLSHG